MIGSAAVDLCKRIQGKVDVQEDVEAMQCGHSLTNDHLARLRIIAVSSASSCATAGSTRRHDGR